MLSSVAQTYDANSGETEERAEFKTLLGYEQVWGQSHMRPCLKKTKTEKNFLVAFISLGWKRLPSSG